LQDGNLPGFGGWGNRFTGKGPLATNSQSNLVFTLGIHIFVTVLEKMRRSRIIGKYEGQLKGPMLVCLGAMHGNEKAGLRAINLMAKMLEVEPITNPDFFFRGLFLGIKGNMAAMRKNTRFIERDLNRIWTPDNVDHVRKTPAQQLSDEFLEMKEILEVIEYHYHRYQPDKLIVLDLHTTTARGGIFSIVTDDPESIRLGVELHAPVIKGMLRGIYGTTLHYFNEEHYFPRTTTVVFESGQHDEPLSVNRAIAAITNCMRTIGCVEEDDVENRHDSLLIEHSTGLPKLAELAYCHPISDEDGFQMLPGYHNFQRVERGEVLAKDRNGDIAAPEDGLILMPLYQPQGEDGFFIIRELIPFDPNDV
jgi:succinylglutamate desuccinylase